MAQSRSEIKRRKKKTPFKRFLKITLLTFLGLFLLAGGAVAYLYIQMANVTSSAQHELDRGDRSELREEVVNPTKDPISVLFLGLDSRDGNLVGRTDAMVLATFNPDEKSIKMLNIPRDSLVEISGRNTWDKINHAHAFGGIDMTVSTVENLLNIPVDYFVSLNFNAFMDIINELGGVEVYVQQGFTEKDNATYGTIVLQEGLQTLNGEEALAYVRMRKSDARGDLGRGDRQKEVLEAIIKQSASFSSITRFGPIMDSLENNLNTNLAFNTILGMHTYAGELDNIEHISFDGENYTQNGIYYYRLNDASVADISQRLRRHLEIDPPLQGTETGTGIETEDTSEPASDY